MLRQTAFRPLPDILAVREDRSNYDKRPAGGPILSDALSVYVEGGPRYRLDKRTHTFTPPMAMLVPEGTLDIDLQEGQVNGIFALFHGHGLLKKGASPMGQVIVRLEKASMTVPHLKQVTDADARRLASVLREISSIRDVNVTAQMRRVSLLLEAIARYCEISNVTESEGIHREAVRLRQLIEERAFENVAMAGIYRELELSSAHAGALFKAAFGVSPVSYRIQIRLRKARELLVASPFNVAQVAYEVGFTDPLYFSRVFHQRFGVAPSSLIQDFKYKRK